MWSIKPRIGPTLFSSEEKTESFIVHFQRTVAKPITAEPVVYPAAEAIGENPAYQGGVVAQNEAVPGPSNTPRSSQTPV